MRTLFILIACAVIRFSPHFSRRLIDSFQNVGVERFTKSLAARKPTETTNCFLLFCSIKNVL